MARPISDEELQLKKRARRRLLGAIVLVSIVAVVLPMVLDSEPKSVNPNIDIRIPSPDAGEFKPKASAPAPGAAEASGSGKLPIEPPKSETSVSAAKPEMTPGSATQPVASPASSSTIAEPSVPAPKSSPKEPAKREAADAAAADSAEGGSPLKGPPKDVAGDSMDGFVVQVAALSDAGRVKQLQKKMAGAGVKTYTEVVSTKGGQITRVRAGPYPTREAAEKARAQLKKAGLDGKVVPK